jgi:hypothetical protein
VREEKGGRRGKGEGRKGGRRRKEGRIEGEGTCCSNIRQVACDWEGGRREAIPFYRRSNLWLPQQRTKREGLQKQMDGLIVGKHGHGRLGCLGVVRDSLLGPLGLPPVACEVFGYCHVWVSGGG